MVGLVLLRSSGIGSALELGAERFVLVGAGNHADEVDVAFVCLLRSPRGIWTGIGFAPSRSRIWSTTLAEVGADAVELVDERDAGDMVFVGLVPDGLGLGLDPADAAEHRDRAVEDAQRVLDLGGEVHVARGVDDVDLVVAPVAGGGGGGDGDAPLLLLLHPVHGGGAFVDLADLVFLAGVVQDALGRGGLARVDVGHDPNISYSINRYCPFQNYPSAVDYHL